MGRVYAPLRVDGKELWALFDSGSRNSYVVRSATDDVPRQSISPPRRVGLGGTTRVLTDVCNLNVAIEDKPVVFQAFVLEDLGLDEGGRPIEVLFGALAMQQWGIRPVPDEEKLDLSHYPEEFIEY